MADITDELLARIWGPELLGDVPEQGPWVQTVETNFSIQLVSSIAVVNEKLVVAVSSIDWSPGAPVINSQFVRIEMGAVAAAADDWRESM